MLEKAGRNLKVAFVASVLAAMLATAPAQAGRYHVYSCRTPTGEVAPTDGWSGSVAAGGAFVILEGGVANPTQARAGMTAGAGAVVVGTALSNLDALVRGFADGIAAERRSTA